MWQKYTHSSPDDSLSYFVYTPDTYRKGTPVPLIVMLHGCTQTAADFATGTRMNRLADQYHFIVAYPQQTHRNNRTLCWNWFKTSNHERGKGEPAMIAGIVQDIEQDKSRWNIDPSRIYVVGASAGAAMAAILGATYPDIFAAVGIHSGSGYRAATNVIGGLIAMRRGISDPLKLGRAAYKAMGAAARVVPTIIFQGAADRLVNPINGERTVRQWMHTAHLASHGTYTATFDKPSHIENGHPRGKHTYTVYKWADNNGKEIQEYWKVDGLGHAWSGGSPAGSYTDRFGPDASLAMYRFFMQHTLSAPAENKEGFGDYLRSIRERLLRGLHMHPPEHSPQNT